MLRLEPWKFRSKCSAWMVLLLVVGPLSSDNRIDGPPAQPDPPPQSDLPSQPEQIAQAGPNLLRRSLDSDQYLSPIVPGPSGDSPFDAGLRYRTPVDPPLGFTGPSSILSLEGDDSDHFVPMEDRWRSGLPYWDRYGKGQPYFFDYPYEIGHWWDPYNQNVLKGDYPILGQHTFLNVSLINFMNFEQRQFPIPTTPFESTRNPFQEEFFGNPNNSFFTNYIRFSVDLFNGNTAGFKQPNWRIKATPVFNVNYLDTNELAVVNPNVLYGTERGRTFFALDEWFVETKLSDTSPYYDILSLRIGSQYFNSDFRGLIFSDINRGIRLFGSAQCNRIQYNLVFFDQTEKDTNSELNTFRDRNQNTLIGNVYYQDFVFPGNTVSLSVHYNHDDGVPLFDKNSFLVRPDPAGVYQPHTIDVVYLGYASDGHWGRYNVSSAFYWVLGHDTLNPIANSPQTVNAQMAFLELSYDRDWARIRFSGFYASGDNNVNDSQARGFDSILDNPNFAGGEFSFWQRQAIRLFGVNLVQRQSFLPDMRTSKIQGQSNFVNPGLNLINAGFDMDVTARVKAINNVNFLWFDKTNPLEVFLFDGNIQRFIGVDISTGVEYRPFLNNNVMINVGVATLLPGSGFRDIYNNLNSRANPLVQGFIETVLAY